MKISILAFALTTLSFSMFAQFNTHNHRDRLTKELNLSAEQQKQMKVILNNYRPTLKAVKTSAVAKEEKRAAKNRLTTELRIELTNILSDEQLRTWDAWQSRKAHKKADRRVAMKSLGLSEQQKSSLKIVNENRREAIQDIRESNMTKEDRKKEHQSVQIATNEEVRQILTEQQYEVWSQHKAHYRRNEMK